MAKETRDERIACLSEELRNLLEDKREEMADETEKLDTVISVLEELN